MISSPSRIGAVLTLLGALGADRALAQDAGAPVAPTTVDAGAAPDRADVAAATPLSALSPTRPPAVLIDESVAAVTVRSRETRTELDKVSRLYDAAQRLFGYEHVLLTSVAYSGMRCSDSSKSSYWRCGDESNARATRSGIGALVGVPLLGGGAGHGAFDWYPRFETRQATEVYLEYQHAVYRWSQLLTKYGKTSSANAEERRLGLLSAARALEQLLNRAVSPFQDPDSDTYTKVNKEQQAKWPVWLRDCVRELIARLEDLALETGAIDAAAQLTPALRSPASRMSDSAAPADALATAVDEETHKTIVTINQKIDGEAEQLDGLWAVYRQLAHVSTPRGRHNYLIGPAVVIPMQDIKREWFYGLVLEVGRPWLRVTLTGGLRASYDNRYVVAPVGWYAGIGVSGEFADDLFHLANGARDAANKLHGELRQAKDLP